MNNLNILLFLVLVVVAVLVLFYLWNGSVVVPNQGESTLPRGATENEEPVRDAETMANTDGKTVTENFHGGGQLNPQDLLPQDYASTWAKANPSGAGSLAGQNFLDATSHIGINTVGQTLRNPNLQLRSEPPNPTVVISPFWQPTIQPDTSRRYLEIGSC